MDFARLPDAMVFAFKGAVILFVTLVALAFFVGRETAGLPQNGLTPSAPPCAESRCSCKAIPGPGTGRLVPGPGTGRFIPGPGAGLLAPPPA